MRRPFTRPGTRPRYAPDRLFDVEHLRIEVDLDFERKSISGVTTISISPIDTEARTLTLDAVEMAIGEVRVKGGRALPFDYDGEKLQISVGEALDSARTKERRLDIEVRYKCTPRRGLYFILPDKGYPKRPVHAWTQGQDEDSRHWFPCFDSPIEKATSEVIATVPAEFVALSNGELIEKAAAGKGRVRYHYRLDTPHSCYLITLVVGAYTEIREKALKGGGPEILYYAPKGREADTKRTLGRTPEMMKLLSDFTGTPYPYGKYAQIFVGEFIFGGMENTTATTLTDGVLYDEVAALDYDCDSLITHELAHQWFGDLLTCRDWGHGWLNEGFATYSEYLWKEHHEGREAAAFERLDFQEQYLREDRERYRRPIATSMYEVPIDLFDHHLYEKGGCVLHMLRRELGEAPFRKAIHHYVSKHAQGSVETRDLVRATEEATGRNLDWFFAQWVERAGHPELKVEFGWDSDKKAARVTVKQTQKVDAERGPVLFKLLTEVLFVVKESGTRTKTLRFPIEIKDDSEVFFFPLPSRPEIALFDPGDHLLKAVDTEKSAPLWRAQLAAGKESGVEAIDRADAARALAKQSDPETVAALGVAVREDRAYQVRAAAASALAQIRSDAARDELILSLATDHPRARRAVVRALGAFKLDEIAFKTLEKKAKQGDESVFVQAETLFSLARTRVGDPFQILVRALKRESFQDVIRQNALRGLAELRDERALPILTEWTKYGDGHSTFARRAALDSLARHVEGREQDLSVARQTIEPLVGDLDFRVQAVAINALSSLGDARAIPVLRRQAERDLDGRIKRRALEVIQDLKEGKNREEALKIAKDESERLDRELRKLRDRLTALELQLPKPDKKSAPEKRKTKGK